MNCGLVGRGRHRGHKTECWKWRAMGSGTAFVGFRQGGTPFASRSPPCAPVWGGDGPSRGRSLVREGREGADLAVHG